ncbi:hypothetical protein LZ31DRAFT_63814 [Colletotrichum somersetense]|nr:hypothetical protein LZ31DRAFT_63814 [Colletotrichum somersetense]
MLPFSLSSFCPSVSSPLPLSLSLSVCVCVCVYVCLPRPALVPRYTAAVAASDVSHQDNNMFRQRAKAKEKRTIAAQSGVRQPTGFFPSAGTRLTSPDSHGNALIPRRKKPRLFLVYCRAGKKKSFSVRSKVEGNRTRCVRISCRPIFLLPSFFYPVLKNPQDFLASNGLGDQTLSDPAKLSLVLELMSNTYPPTRASCQENPNLWHGVAACSRRMRRRRATHALLDPCYLPTLPT